MREMTAGRRRWMTTAVTGLMLVALTGSAQAATETMTGSLEITGVSEPSVQQTVSAQVTVSYNCEVSSDPEDSCSGWNAYVYLVPADQPCGQDRGSVWSTNSNSYEPQASLPVSWNEYQYGPYPAPARQVRACLYGYTGLSGTDLLSQALYTVAQYPQPQPAPTPSPAPSPEPVSCPLAPEVTAPVSRLAARRTMPLIVAASDGTPVSALRLEVTQAGRVVVSKAFSRAQIGRLDDSGVEVPFRSARRGPVTAKLRWTGPAGCPAGEDMAAFSVVRGTAGRVRVISDGLQFGARRGRSCWEVEPRKLSVMVRAGGRSRTLSLRSPCGSWLSGARQLPGLAAIPTDGDEETRPAGLSLRARRSGLSRRVASVTVRSGPRRVAAARFVAVWRHRPARKVWAGTDAFINYCIDRTRPLTSENLRLYCWRPGHTTSYVRRL